MKKLILFLTFSIAVLSSVKAKTERLGAWIELELSKEIFDKIEFSLIPEVRLQDNFTVDEYQFDGKLSYQPFKFIEFAGAYRINTNVKKKENEISHRLVFDVIAKMDINRFEPSLRARYVHNNTRKRENGPVIRPRLKVAYDIKKSRFKPYCSYELYQNIRSKKIEKSRLRTGINRKVGELHRVGIYYQLQQYYIKEKQRFNIFGIDYQIKI